MSTLRRARARLRITLRRRRPGARSADRRLLARGRQAAERGLLWARRVGQRVAPALTAIISLPLVAAAALIALVARIAAWFARRIDTLSAIVTPTRAVAAIGAAACLLLGVSQFVHFSAVEVDPAGYPASIGRVAPVGIAAPRDEGTAHAYVLLPIAAIALVLIALTLRGRWRLGRLVALCGFAGIAITLLIDLPKGLDAGTAGLAYSGSKALLTQGFYAQLSASAVLALCGALLGGFVHSSHPTPRGRARRRLRGRQRERARVPIRSPAAPLSRGTGA